MAVKPNAWQAFSLGIFACMLVLAAWETWRQWGPQHEGTVTCAYTRDNGLPALVVLPVGPRGVRTPTHWHLTDTSGTWFSLSRTDSETDCTFEHVHFRDQPQPSTSADPRGATAF